MDLSGDPSFRELLRRVRETALEAYAHQDLPFEKLVEELQPEREPWRNPLFQVMFALQNAPRAELRLRGLTLSGDPIERSTTRFDLEVHLWESDGSLSVGYAYSTELFDASTMERMVGAFCEVAGGGGVGAGPWDLGVSVVDGGGAFTGGGGVEPDGDGVSAGWDGVAGCSRERRRGRLRRRRWFLERSV